MLVFSSGLWPARQRIFLDPAGITGICWQKFNVYGQPVGSTFNWMETELNTNLFVFEELWQIWIWFFTCIFPSKLGQSFDSCADSTMLSRLKLYLLDYPHFTPMYLNFVSRFPLFPLALLTLFLAALYLQITLYPLIAFHFRYIIH